MFYFLYPSIMVPFYCETKQKKNNLENNFLTKHIYFIFFFIFILDCLIYSFYTPILSKKNFILFYFFDFYNTLFSFTLLCANFLLLLLPIYGLLSLFFFALGVIKLFTTSYYALVFALFSIHASFDN